MISPKVLAAGTTAAILTEIKAACAGAPLNQVSPGIWELNADLVLQNGARLVLDAGGDVRELRLQSLPSGLATEVSAITAQYGQIDIRGVSVTSRNGTGPDTDPAVPAGGMRGRAFVRALSVMEGSTAGPSMRGTAARPTGVTFQDVPAGAVTIKKDAFSTATFSVG
jgi:mannuronan 5-epimerase